MSPWGLCLADLPDIASLADSHIEQGVRGYRAVHLLDTLHVCGSDDDLAAGMPAILRVQL